MGRWQAGAIIQSLDRFPRAHELKPTHRLVLATLFSFSDDPKVKPKGWEPLAYPSAAKVAGRCGVAPRTVQRAFKHMEKTGAILGQHRNRKPTIWSLHPTLRDGVAYVEQTADEKVFPHLDEVTNEVDACDAETHDMSRGDASDASEGRKSYDAMTDECSELSRRAVQNSSDDDAPSGAGASAALRTGPYGASASSIERHAVVRKGDRFRCSHGDDDGLRRVYNGDGSLRPTCALCWYAEVMRPREAPAHAVAPTVRHVGTEADQT